MRYLSDYPKHRAAHLRRLGASQVLPLVGDGSAAAAITSAATKGLLGCDPLPGDREDLRARLTAARYLDWRQQQTKPR